MGFYLNSAEPLGMYREIVNSPYFVDKSLVLTELNDLIGTAAKYICVTRPRRFGKSVIASLIGAYYSNACDAAAVFNDVGISETKGYQEHLNSHNVIYIDFSNVDDDCDSYREYISTIKDILREDLHTAYPDVAYRAKGSVIEDLQRIRQKTEQKFIFVLDEWDAVFHMNFVKAKDREKYLLFLKSLLKGKSYVELAYMTGILPIAKYSSGSELNMFVEFTMSTQQVFGDCFGFTESEIDMLYSRYQKNTEETQITREELKKWYDGYHTLSGERIYNPRSVVVALTYNQIGNYWTSSGPYDEIFYYIRNNVDGVKDDIALMVAGEAVLANVQEYAATSTNLGTRDEILSAMIVYGFLTCKDGKVSIPNKELMDKFSEMVRKEKTLGYVYRLAKESDRMLAATLAGDTAAMEIILRQAHDTETGMMGYSNETELSAVIKLVYLSARDKYDIQREDKAGVGYVDYIFYPVINRSDDCIIIELKVDCTAAEAIAQIKNRNYMQRLIGKLGEEPKYTGRILAVGIAYQRKDTAKQHECKIEVLRERI